jgi:hypothetical protein
MLAAPSSSSCFLFFSFFFLQLLHPFLTHEHEGTRPVSFTYACRLYPWSRLLGPRYASLLVEVAPKAPFRFSSTKARGGGAAFCLLLLLLPAVSAYR